MPEAHVVLHHAGVRVRDLAASLRFYEQVLGLRPLYEFSLKAADARALFRIRTACRFATLAAGLGRLELMWAGGRAWTRVPGQHLCLGTRRRGALLARLKRAGVAIREIRHAGRRIVFVADPDGNLIELKTLRSNRAASA